jgi:serine O-acetyltransferase
MTADVECASSGMSFSQLVFSDWERHRPGSAPVSWRQILPRCLALTGILASFVIRAQQCLHRSGHVRSAWLLRSVGILTLNCDFVPPMTIGPGLYIPHPVGIVIGAGLRIGSNVTIGQGVTAGVREADENVRGQSVPTICDGAKILANASLVGGVRVGVGAQVGANSLVVADVPDYAVVVGVPARKIGEVERPEADPTALAPAE